MRSRADLLLEEIARVEKLEVSDEEILEALKEEAARQKTSAPALRARLNKEGRLESLKTKMLREKSLDLVEESANIMTKGNGP
jgi:trigger factor